MVLGETEEITLYDEWIVDEELTEVVEAWRKLLADG